MSENKRSSGTPVKKKVMSEGLRKEEHGVPKVNFIMAVALVRFTMLVFGEIMDKVSDVKYTDVDY